MVHIFIYVDSNSNNKSMEILYDCPEKCYLVVFSGWYLQSMNIIFIILK